MKSGVSEKTEAREDVFQERELTEIQIKGITAFANDVFDELYSEYMSTDELELMDGYLRVISYLADREPVLAAELISCMLLECDLDNLVDEMVAFVPADKKHLNEFTRRFAIAGIIRKLEEEMEEEEIEDSCHGCFGGAFNDCPHCRHQ